MNESGEGRESKPAGEDGRGDAVKEEGKLSGGRGKSGRGGRRGKREDAEWRKDEGLIVTGG